MPAPVGERRGDQRDLPMPVGDGQLLEQRTVDAAGGGADAAASPGIQEIGMEERTRKRAAPCSHLGAIRGTALAAAWEEARPGGCAQLSRLRQQRLGLFFQRRRGCGFLPGGADNTSNLRPGAHLRRGFF